MKVRLTLFLNSMKNKKKRLCIYYYTLWKYIIDKWRKIGPGLGTIPLLRNWLLSLSCKHQMSHAHKFHFCLGTSYTLFIFLFPNFCPYCKANHTGHSSLPNHCIILLKKMNFIYVISFQVLQCLSSWIVKSQRGTLLTLLLTRRGPSQSRSWDFKSQWKAQRRGRWR